ncbi:Myb-like DNA-binding domain containing protein [Tritrichomonas foetus]|uniref:Myb-like DNA-binding domain containing protein n=1 Tax=Tritrichomonas foetus TaxID=1144522 RepID=A0A1J4L4Q5_9EUKA|nr:Myb-like DNA-binding domain containing protein [Tritrichomonas foetus]|eukprot:OHT16910.1 Myb-like DNA-binding domain containing protein [Tritrichomonas foetus]
MSNKSRRENAGSKSNPFAECSTCKHKFKNERYIRCLKCPKFAQCIQCLSLGIQNDLHFFTHNFIVVEPPASRQLYRENWDQEEEILLLYGIKMLGLGNWGDISDFMQSKTALECETHYINTYINSTNAPFPIRKILPEEPLPPPPPFDTRTVESAPSEGHAMHLKEKGKREPTTPAEYSDFMPYRHEFDKDKDFENDGEILVADIHFNCRDEQSQFLEKVEQLKNYNRILTERRFRTAVIEEWDIHHIEITGKNKNNMTEEDFDAQVLKGITREDKAVDKKLISLAPYLGKEKTVNLADLLHNRQKKVSLIENRQMWQVLGVKSLHEGQLFNALNAKIKDDKIIPSEIDDWNDRIHKYNIKHGKSTSTEDENLLEKEKELISKENLSSHIYLVYKNLLIREFTIWGKLPRSKLRMMPKEHQRHLEAVYDLCVELGWIAAA